MTVLGVECRDPWGPERALDAQELELLAVVSPTRVLGTKLSFTKQ